MPLAPFSRVQVADEETRLDATYCFDNSVRTDINQLAIQRTVSGAAFFQDEHGRHLVKAGQAMLFTHREPTRYGYPPEATEAYRLQYIAFSPAPTVRGLFDALRLDFGSVIPLEERSEAFVLFDEIMQCFQQHNFQDQYHESELLYRLLTTLYRQQVSGKKKSDPVEYGFHYLQNNFRKPINLKQVAQICRISREHFIREFRRRYQETPANLLRRLRLEHAKVMLHTSDTPVEDIAVASGFASRNSFTRAYQRQFKTNPAAHRSGPTTRRR